MRPTLILALAAAAVILPTAASARPPYKQAFAQNYQVKPGSTLDKAGCNLCHMGASKALRNPYGADLAKVLGKANASNDETLVALKKVEGLVSSDKKTKYVDLIKADKLPGEAPK